MVKPETIADFFIKEQPLIIEKIHSQAEIAPNQAKTGLIEATKFLCLSAVSTETLTPSKRVDDVWHEMILFTRTYNDTCLQYFGTFIHHQPSDNIINESNQFQTTIKKYMDTFGDPNDFFWGIEHHSKCGPCESN